MDAVIFDFDGVIVDSEPIHLRCYQAVLGPLGVHVTSEDYYARYVGVDDRDCMTMACRDAGVAPTAERLQRLIADKTALMQREFSRSLSPLPGAVELIRAAATASPLAICSGALAAEIDLALRIIGVGERFKVIVAAEDVSRGKPDPEGYALALQRLSHAAGRPVRAGRTVVVEDAPAGIQAAKALGLKVLAVASSHRPAALAQADRVVQSLADASAEMLEALAS